MSGLGKRESRRGAVVAGYPGQGQDVDLILLAARVPFRRNELLGAQEQVTALRGPSVADVAGVRLAVQQREHVQREVFYQSDGPRHLGEVLKRQFARVSFSSFGERSCRSTLFYFSRRFDISSQRSALG